MWGRLSDVFGRKITLLACVAIFLVGSLACALAQTMLQLIIFRGMQGVGGGGLLTLVLIVRRPTVPSDLRTLTFVWQQIVSDIVSLKDRGKYQGASARSLISRPQHRSRLATQASPRRQSWSATASDLYWGASWWKSCHGGGCSGSVSRALPASFLAGIRPPPLPACLPLRSRYLSAHFLHCTTTDTLALGRSADWRRRHGRDRPLPPSESGQGLDEGVSACSLSGAHRYYTY